MSRPTCAVIDLEALSANLNFARKLAPQQKIMAVVKANAYGHGLVRVACVLNSCETPVLVKGQAVPLVGQVSMDMLSVDLRKAPRARVGDTMVLWGKGLPLEIIAKQADTIPYELLCGVNKRIRFIENGPR
ncbi:MAG: alanine racemase [Gammaproteobacteria bacterium]|nr:alanine racemase [Gammaproteobacteria bacterium]